MGKRSQNNQTFYQCGWTAWPLARPSCQFPVWKTGEDGKRKERLTKIGSYLNWECVVAKAEQLASASEISQDMLDRVRLYVQERTGVDMLLTKEALSTSRSSTPREPCPLWWLVRFTRWSSLSPAVRRLHASRTLPPSSDPGRQGICHHRGHCAHVVCYLLPPFSIYYLRSVKD